jgi:hypothetical protein
LVSLKTKEGKEKKGDRGGFQKSEVGKTKTPKFKFTLQFCSLGAKFWLPSRSGLLPSNPASESDDHDSDELGLMLTYVPVGRGVVVVVDAGLGRCTADDDDDNEPSNVCLRTTRVARMSWMER